MDNNQNVNKNYKANILFNYTIYLFIQHLYSALFTNRYALMPCKVTESWKPLTQNGLITFPSRMKSEF